MLWRCLAFPRHMSGDSSSSHMTILCPMPPSPKWHHLSVSPTLTSSTHCHITTSHIYVSPLTLKPPRSTLGTNLTAGTCFQLRSTYTTCLFWWMIPVWFIYFSLPTSPSCLITRQGHYRCTLVVMAVSHSAMASIWVQVQSHVTSSLKICLSLGDMRGIKDRVTIGPPISTGCQSTVNY